MSTQPASHHGTVQIAVPEPEVWLGIPMRMQPAKNKLIKTVMFLSLCGAAFHITQFVLQVLLLRRSGTTGSNNYAEETINLLILLTIPYCGWKGAKDNDKNFLCWFCGCNLACAIYWPAMAMLVHAHIEDVEAWCDDCGVEFDFDYDDPDDFNNSVVRDYVDACLYERSLNRNINVEYCTTSNIDFLNRMRNDLITVQIPLALLSFVTFYYGNNLYKADDKIQIDPFPNNAMPDMPALLVAQTSTISALPQQPMHQQPMHPQNNYVASIDYSNRIDYSNPPSPSPSPFHPGGLPVQAAAFSAAPTFAEIPFAGEASPAHRNGAMHDGVVTLMKYMKKTNGKFGVMCMCVWVVCVFVFRVSA
jgi:hypothetical protein